MYCSYHPTNAARAQCNSCSRALCAGCDHRIKGLPYCQDCIVMGIESLSRHHNYYNVNHSKRRARKAAFCALLPGLGAAYNRQNVKAVVHFVTVMGLFQLTEINMLEGFFAFAGIAFYFYSIIDAYRTAQLIAQGESPAADEERFKRRLIKQAPFIGGALVAAGLLLVIQMIRPFSISIGALFSVALIVLGGYLLTRHFKRSREESYAPQYQERPPFSLVSGQFADQNSRSIGSRSRPSDHR